MGHIRYSGKESMSPWRKVSIGSWKPTGDSSIHAFEEFDVEPALKWCESNGVGINAFWIKAVAKTIEKEKRVNSVIRFGRMYHRANIRIFYHILPSLKRDDLSGALLDEAESRTVKEVEEDLNNQIQLIKAQKDDFTRSKRTFRRLHPIFSRPLLNLLSFTMYGLNIYPPMAPSQRDPFGSIMITNIGSLRLTKACTPIAPYTRIPMVIALGKVEKRPIVHDDSVHITSMMSVGFTFDHRILDGIHFSRFIQVLRAYIENPESIE